MAFKFEQVHKIIVLLKLINYNDKENGNISLNILKFKDKVSIFIKQY